MILAAGRGERMRPLTDRVPKALVEAGGRPLIVYLIERLARAGIRDLVVNVSHLAGMIEQSLGDGSNYGVRIVYSREARALETGGGIAYALPLLGAEPFVVVNSDIYSDFDFAGLADVGPRLAREACLAHLVLVDNPPHHPRGDFSLRADAVSADADAPRLTFSGIGAYAPRLFAGVARGSRCALSALLGPAMAERQVAGEHFRGLWADVGTPQRLADLERALASRAGR